MLKGIYLTLMVGPIIPIPVPQVVLDALTEVEVTVASGQDSGFSLKFNLSKNSPLQTLFLLSGGAVPPLIRVILVVTIGGRADVIMDGVVTQTSITPGQGGNPATLDVMGHDLSKVMEMSLFDTNGMPFPAMPAEARVALLIAKYTVPFGMIPLVIPSVNIDIPIPVKEIPRQQGNDLAYIKKLAREVGYTFYLTPGPLPGANVAYWGPEIRVGVPQPALNIDMDMHSNVESLSFQFHNNRKKLPIFFIQNEQTKIPIPIPISAINPLSPPLGLIPPIPTGIKRLTNTAKQPVVRALAQALAQDAQDSAAVTGSGNLNVLRYGRVLKARQLVGVRGAGLAFDGLYYVKSVTHHLKRGEYKQNFELVRNGLISTLPRVPA